MKRVSFLALCTILCSGVVGTSHASGSVSESDLSGRMEAQSIQRALHYEWMLGAQLDPEMTACLDIKLGATWSMPSTGSAHVSERLIERAQRAHEECSAIISAGRLAIERRFVTASLRQEFKKQLQARRAQEQTKMAVRACMRVHELPTELRRCLAQNTSIVLTELNWPLWLAIFERFRDHQPTGNTGKPG